MSNVTRVTALILLYSSGFLWITLFLLDPGVKSLNRTGFIT